MTATAENCTELGDGPRLPPGNHVLDVSNRATPSWPERLRIIVLPTLRGYRPAWLGTDLYASLILWTLLVPQGLAYAQTAGLPPQYGLYAALGGMVGYAVIGVSRQATIGPEATVALLSATVVAPMAAGDATAFAALSAALGLLVGLVCAGIGLLRLGLPGATVVAPGPPAIW